MSDSHPWEDPDWQQRADSFAASLGLLPEQFPLVRRALTHRSLAGRVPHGDNERLEFLGDSVLALLVNDHLYQAYPASDEGHLTRLKQRYVCEAALAEASEALGVGPLLLIARGDDVPGSRQRPSTLSDAFEALIAALYIAQGIEAARAFVARELIDRVAVTDGPDAKTRLQEWYQERHRITPAYRTVSESGEAHRPVFLSQALAGEEMLGEGTGGSKKAAEQAAAADALARLAKPKRRTRN